MRFHFLILLLSFFFLSQLSHAENIEILSYFQAQPPQTMAPMVVHLDQPMSYARVRLQRGLLGGSHEAIRKQVFQYMRLEADFLQQTVRRKLQDLQQRGHVKRIDSFFLSNAIAFDGDDYAYREIQKLQNVRKIYLDLEKSLLPVEGQPKILQGETRTPWGIRKVRAREAHQRGATGAGVRIAIVDTGIDPSHSAFSPGQIDLTNAASFAPGEEDNIQDGHGHGTHCAGTASSHPYGVALNATIVPVKIFSARGRTTMRAILKGLEHAAQHADVISNSWGGGPTEEPGPDEEVIRNMAEAGRFVTIAAGNAGPNPGTVGSPALMVRPGVLAVAATNENNQAAYFSSRGPTVRGDSKPDIAAPGVDILSALPGDRKAEWSGTSMATPHLTGMAALLWGQYPELTNIQLAELILKATQDNSVPNATGAGTIDCLKALDLADQEIKNTWGLDNAS